jgi:thiosulfate dehydrogenase (quinone) large subunit
MNANCCDPRAAAVALGRWGLGVVFLFYGIGKLPDLSGFVSGYLTPMFEKTWLPQPLVAAFGYTLPFFEVALGVLLIIGLARNAVLFATGLLLIGLTFGQVLLQQSPVVFQNMGYLAMTIALLFLSAYDDWVPFGREKDLATGTVPPTAPPARAKTMT